MRLLVPTRICLALRWATTPAASRVVTRAPAHRRKKASVFKPATLSETTWLRNALAHLDAGENEEFRAEWRGKLLGGELSNNEALHEALVRSAERGTPDPAMLRWYAESLNGEQRAPFQAKPQFEYMMAPVVRALGGRIEKWEEDDKRKEKLRKWRDDYKDEALEKLLVSMLDYVTHLIDEKKFTASNLVLLESALERVKKQERTVVVNWSDIVYNGATSSLNLNDLLPRHSLVQVGREAESKLLTFCDFDLLQENDRFMKEPSAVKGTMRLDSFCTLMLAVAARGHWLSNGTLKYDTTWDFSEYNTKKKKKAGSRQAKLLRYFAHESVLRYTNSGVVQPAVDHSRAPQFIDQEKKELAFTVARDLQVLPPKHAYKSIEYYSIHLD